MPQHTSSKSRLPYVCTIQNRARPEGTQTHNIQIILGSTTDSDTSIGVRRIEQMKNPQGTMRASRSHEGGDVPQGGTVNA